MRLLQDNPKFAEELYGLLGRHLPDHTDVKCGSEAMTRGDEAVVRNCDNVAVYYEDEQAVFALLFETQLREDKRKHYSWFDYIASARSRLKCPVALVVITFDETTAKWANKPIETGHPGLILYPLVIGPDQIPIITNPAEGRENVPLALLSLITHSKGEHGRKVMRAYCESIRHLDQDRWSRYAGYALNALRKELGMQLEEIIMSDKTLPDSYREGLFGEKYREGEAKGKAEGKAEGQVEGQQQMVILILESRGFDVTKAVRKRIESYDDPRKLKAIARRAFSTRDLEDVLYDNFD